MLPVAESSAETNLVSFTGPGPNEESEKLKEICCSRKHVHGYNFYTFKIPNRGKVIRHHCKTVSNAEKTYSRVSLAQWAINKFKSKSSTGNWNKNYQPETIKDKQNDKNKDEKKLFQLDSTMNTMKSWRFYSDERTEGSFFSDLLEVMNDGFLKPRNTSSTKGEKDLPHPSESRIENSSDIGLKPTLDIRLHKKADSGDDSITDSLDMEQGSIYPESPSRSHCTQTTQDNVTPSNSENYDMVNKNYFDQTIVQRREMELEWEGMTELQSTSSEVNNSHEPNVLPVEKTFVKNLDASVVEQNSLPNITDKEDNPKHSEAGERQCDTEYTQKSVLDPCKDLSGSDISNVPTQSLSDNSIEPRSSLHDSDSTDVIGANCASVHEDINGFHVVQESNLTLLHITNGEKQHFESSQDTNSDYTLEDEVKVTREELKQLLLDVMRGCSKSLLMIQDVLSKRKDILCKIVNFSTLKQQIACAELTKLEVLEKSIRLVFFFVTLYLPETDPLNQEAKVQLNKTQILFQEFRNKILRLKGNHLGTGIVRVKKESDDNADKEIIFICEKKSPGFLQTGTFSNPKSVQPNKRLRSPSPDITDFASTSCSYSKNSKNYNRKRKQKEASINHFKAKSRCEANKLYIQHGQKKPLKCFTKTTSNIFSKTQRSKGRRSSDSLFKKPRVKLNLRNVRRSSRLKAKHKSLLYSQQME